MPSDHPETAQEHQHVMTEIDLDNDQGDQERGGTAATDLQLESGDCMTTKLLLMLLPTLPGKELHCLLYRRLAP